MNAQQNKSIGKSLEPPNKEEILAHEKAERKKRRKGQKHPLTRNGRSNRDRESR